MRLKIALLISFLGQLTFSQVRLEGIVKDSLGTTLEYANIVAINQATKILDAYAISNDKGRYKLDLKKNATYELSASFVGMKTQKIRLATKETNISKDFILGFDVNLKEVEIVHDMPVVVKGDTLVYNADSFKSQADRKLEDVLNKLPGVEVNDDGEIEIEGTTVTKVMVEGKDFFDGDSKLATKNIPANALDKIEILKNYDEIGQLRNVRNNEDNIAINIKLKEGKKSFWFGDINTGIGVADELYIFNPKLFYYSPEYSINIISNLNNIGDAPFTRKDYFKFSGGFRGVSRNSGTIFNVASSDIGFLTLQNNRANDIEAKFGAANFSFSPKKTLDLSGYAIYSGNKTNIVQNSTRIYTENNGAQPQPDEFTTSDTEQKTDLGLLKLSASYKPNADNQLDYDVFGRISQQHEFNDFFSSILRNIDETQEQNPFSVNQNLNYYYTLNEKHIFSFEGQFLIQEEDPFYNAEIERAADGEPETFRLANTLGLRNTPLVYNVSQENLVKTQKLDAKIDHWFVINEKSNLNTRVGFLSGAQQFNSSIYQILEDGNQFTLDNAIDSTMNDIDYNFYDSYIAMQYSLKAGIFTFRPGFSLHNYSTKNAQVGTDTTDNFVRFLPRFNTRLQLKKSETLSLNYNMQTTFTDINNLAEALVLNNYNTLFQGNRELENALSHNVNLNYSSFNMFNYTNVFGRLSYSKRMDQIRNNSRFLPGTTNRINVPFNSNFADETASANGRIERTFGKIKANLGGRFSYSKFNQFVNNRRSVNETFTQNYNSRISTNFKNAPNIQVGYNFTVNDYNQGNGSSSFFTHRPYINFDAYFLKAFTFKTKYSYYNYRNEETTLNNYDFLEASLGYQKKDSKWEYELSATNILDTKSLNRDSVNNLFTTTTEYFVQPRFVVFKVWYSL